MPSSSPKSNRNSETEINQTGSEPSGVGDKPRIVGADDWLASCVHLHNYLNRIGAEIKNFKRAVVATDEGRYQREIAVISFDRDGAVTIRREGKIIKDDPDLEPNDVEKAGIKQEFQSGKLPYSTKATKAQYERTLLREMLPRDAVTYPAYDKSGQLVLMVQQRIETESGKAYVPWTFWSDGHWRNMEPDGELPLFGLDRLRGNPRCIMLHEGAKAGDRLNWMFNENSREAWEARAAHPWASDLENFAHVGWVGGALNPHRTDWSPLPSDALVIMVCDNDKPGMDAAPKISKLIKRSMRAVVFNDDFPEAFDLADEFPKEMFKTVAGETIYTGPSMRDLEIDATWATHQFTNPATGRTITKIRSEFSKDWFWSVDPKAFIHRSNPRKIYSEESFNAAVFPFSDVARTSDLLMDEFSQQVSGICYEPGEKTGIVAVDGERKINTFAPARIAPKKGNAQPFIDYMEHLIPNEQDRTELLRWMATLVVHPETKMRYGVLLISKEQGVGKSTLAEKILRPLVGEWNCSTPSANQIADSAYNSWLARKRLAICHEIYEGHRSKAYDRLKDVIGDEVITVNEKYQPAYELKNCIHVFACSNSLRALKISNTDRRLLIPEVTTHLKPKAYWVELNAWLNSGGLAIIYHWLIEFLKREDIEPVSPADRAPDGAMKQAVIKATWSEGQQLLADLADALKERHKTNGERIVSTIRETREWLRIALNRRENDPLLESPETVSDMLKRGGMCLSGRRMKVAGRTEAVFANFEIDEGAGWPELKADYKKHTDLATIFGEVM